MARISSRRTFVKQASLFLAGAHMAPWIKIAAAADAGSVVADTSSGKIRGLVVEDIKIFKWRSVWWDDGGRQPLHATDETGSMDRCARCHRLRTDCAAIQREMARSARAFQPRAKTASC